MDTNAPAPAAVGGGVAAPEGPAPGSEIRPGVFAPLTPTAAGIPAPRPSIGDRIRERREAAQQAAAGDPAAPEGAAAPEAPEGTPAPTEAAEGAPVDAAPTPEGEEPPAGEPTDGGEPAPELMVELPASRAEEEPVSIEVSDPAVAERLRQLSKGFARRQEAEKIRDEGMRLREEAEAINYAVELDPAGVVTETLQSPADRAHLARFLLSDPAVFEKVRDFATQLIDDPDSAQQLSALVNAERIQRKEHMTQKVQLKQELDRNARSLVRSAERSVESLAPSSFSDEAKAQLYRDVLRDVQGYAQERNLRLVDPRIVPGMVQARLARYGVAPGAKQGPTTDKAAPTPSAALRAAGSPAQGKPQPTGAQFKAAAVAKRAAASPPPGVGAPTPSALARPPKYDPSQPGTPIQQAAQWARQDAARRRQGPQ